MNLLDTSTLTPASANALTPGDRLQVYNGLDCCVTLEVFEEIFDIIGGDTPRIYDFERGLQGPSMEMMMRGFKIDQYERQKGIAMLSRRAEHLQGVLDRLAYAVWDRPLNPRSPKQLIDFFYGAMKLPEQWISQKGVKKLSTNRETLEKLEIYFHARPIIATILAIRDVTKKLSVLETEVDGDGRMRTSYNIGGTETWRFSSSSSASGTGTNLQNITAELRKIFVADDGWKLCGIDLEQAESREVGWQCGLLFGDWRYLDACYAGDLHTFVCKMCWPDLNWPSDPKAAKAMAEEKFYRDYSRRDMAKKLGHGSNYYGQPFTMSRHAKIPVKLAENFQHAYFEAFPGIPQWHRWCAQQLQTSHSVTNAWGVTRHFFGRPNDDATLREAIAFGPQSSTAMRMNLGLYRLWSELGTTIRLLAQVHDAVYFLYPPHLEDEIIPRALDLIDIRLTHGDRQLIVPGEAKVGWNWGNYSTAEDVAKGKVREANPNGLMKWKPGGDKRERITGLDRIM